MTIYHLANNHPLFSLVSPALRSLVCALVLITSISGVVLADEKASDAPISEQIEDLKKALIGLSGGIDSAVVAALATESLGPENVIGVSMPSRYSSDHSKSDAAELARRLGIRYEEIAIEAAYQAYLDIPCQF